MSRCYPRVSSNPSLTKKDDVEWLRKPGNTRAGNELSENSGWYETFFRGYDAALGRFMQVDPLASLYNSHSPYHFAYNNPVMFNDPFGAEADSTGRDSGSGPPPIPRYFDTQRFGPGSGNYWSDGSKYSDWSANGGSETYRAGLAAGMTDIGGNLYQINSDGTRSQWTSQNGRAGTHQIDAYWNGKEAVFHEYFVPALQGNDPPGDGRGNAMSFSFGFAAIFGISGEWGIVTDETGASKSYYTVSANFGLGLDLGINYKEIIPTNGKSFRVNHYQGRGKNLSSGILFTSEGRGGNTTGNPNLNPFDFGITYKERSISGSPLMGTFLPVGLSDVGWIYQMSKTNFYK